MAAQRAANGRFIGKKSIALATEVSNVNVKSATWTNGLKNDNIYPDVEIKPLADITGLKTVDRLTKAIVSNGKIVHVASDNYGLLKNEDFFIEAERKLIDADIDYVTRSINRGDSQFAVDYILKSEKNHITVKNGMDRLMPMMRLVNTYDGTSSVMGSFGFYREVCTNGLHVGQLEIDFKVRHKKDVVEVVMPNLQELISKFMSNEYYEIHKNFNILSNTVIEDVEDYLEFITDEVKLFSVRKGGDEEAEELSKSAKRVIEIMEREGRQLGQDSTLWLGYNALNEYLHETTRSFANQRKLDRQLFDLTLEYAKG